MPKKVTGQKMVGGKVVNVYDYSQQDAATKRQMEQERLEKTYGKEGAKTVRKGQKNPPFDQNTRETSKPKLKEKKKDAPGMESLPSDRALGTRPTPYDKRRQDDTRLRPLQESLGETVGVNRKRQSSKRPTTAKAIQDAKQRDTAPKPKTAAPKIPPKKASTGEIDSYASHLMDMTTKPAPPETPDERAKRYVAESAAKDKKMAADAETARILRANRYPNISR